MTLSERTALADSVSRVIRCRIFLKKNSKTVTNIIPATRVTRVEVTPYATYLYKTWIT